MASDAHILPLGSEEPVNAPGQVEVPDKADHEKAMEETLDNFRQLWKKELKSKPASKPAIHTRDEKKSGGGTSSHQDTASTRREEQAKSLFMEGVNSERRGNMYEAIQYYRHAMHLVPDIEFRISESSSSNAASTSASNETSSVDDDDDDDKDDQSAQLSTLTTDTLKSHCEPRYSRTDTHISALPVELLLMLFRWVVSSDLDLRALEQLSMVCRGFYVCARDPELWRESCLKLFGRSSILTKDYLDWRHMYLERPHVQFNGVYISKTTYFRQGEPSMDAFYRPWHQVEYYRYVRVFPDGLMLMHNTPDEPQNVVTKLKKHNCVLPGIMVGRYRMVSDVVTAVLHKENTKEYDPVLRRYTRRKHRISNQLPDSEQTFHIEFGICGGMDRINLTLDFNCYSCHTVYRSTGNSNITEFDIGQFSPLYFSRVKSFTTMSHKPL